MHSKLLNGCFWLMQVVYKMCIVVLFNHWVKLSIMQSNQVDVSKLIVFLSFIVGPHKVTLCVCCSYGLTKDNQGYKGSIPFMKKIIYLRYYLPSWTLDHQILIFSQLTLSGLFVSFWRHICRQGPNFKFWPNDRLNPNGCHIQGFKARWLIFFVCGYLLYMSQACKV